MALVCIPETQRSLHVASEAAAIVIAAPFLVWLAARPSLPPWARWVSATLAAGTLVIDGYLLAEYLRKSS